MDFSEIPEFLIKKINSGEKPYIAVRESYLRLLLELCKHRKKPIIGKIAGTLQELAIQLIQSNFYNPRIMTEQERLFIVRNAIKKAGIPLWKSSAYIEIIDNRIRELKEHNISTEMLKICSKKIKGNLSKKIKKTAEILSNYNFGIETYRKYDIFSLFEEAKNKEPPYTEIILFFIPQILPLEIDFLNSLNIPITVLTFKDNNSIFTKLSRENLKLVKNWKIIEVKPCETALNFSFKPEKNIEEIELIETSYVTESEGIKLVALFIKKLLADGIPPEKIAVAGRSLEGKEILFYEAFREMKIPLFSQYKGIPVNLHPAVKKFLSSIEKTEEKLLTNWCISLKKFVENENAEEELIKELEILNREIEALTELNIIEKNKLSGVEFLELLKILTKSRTFLISEEEPFGVFIGTPENIPSSLATHIILFDFSSGSYPRSFPFDPDFSYQEREEINRVLNLDNPILEALPGRKKLIMYEFQTFYNILATKPDQIIFTYHKDKGSSTFLSILKTYTKVKEENQRFNTKNAERIISIYRNKSQPESPIEWGIIRWKEKLEGAKEMNFIFNTKLISRYLPKNLSVTDIISYFDCPTEFFFTKIIKYPKTPTIEAIEGQIYHEFIRRYFNEKKEPEALFEEIFEEMTKDADIPHIEYHKPFIRDNILKFVSIWKPITKNFEQEKPLKISINNSLSLSGRADWIRKNNGKFNIIDFKRSNVNTGDYNPGKVKSFQIILYGLSLIDDNIVKVVKQKKHKNINFTFISIPKAHKKNNPKTWIKSFSGENITREIMATITWILTGHSLIKKGFFPPLKINPYKPGSKYICNLSLKASRTCPYSNTLSDEIKEKFKETIKKIFKIHYENLWKTD
ncbi:PD-(D/E)XK nuclease family protein [Desulfurobacterium sp.]